MKQKKTLPSYNSILQPVLTLALVILLIIMGITFFSNRNKSNDDTSLRQVYNKVPFDDAVAKFENSSYEVYTRGSILVKKTNVTATPTVDPQKKQSTSEQTIEFEENPYNNLFFYTNNGQVKRLDIKTNGENVTYLHTPKNEIIIMNLNLRTYTTYPVPADEETKALEVFSGVNNVIQSTFPIVPLLKEYREGKFTPVEKSLNLYSGKWQHPLFTSGEVLDVYIETDADTGLFKSFNVVQNVQAPATRIYFDFKPLESANNIYNIPNGFTEVPVQTPYKVKS